MKTIVTFLAFVKFVIGCILICRNDKDIIFAKPVAQFVYFKCVVIEVIILSSLHVLSSKYLLN